MTPSWPPTLVKPFWSCWKPPGTKLSNNCWNCFYWSSCSDQRCTWKLRCLRSVCLIKVTHSKFPFLFVRCVALCRINHPSIQLCSYRFGLISRTLYGSSESANLTWFIRFIIQESRIIAADICKFLFGEMWNIGSIHDDVIKWKHFPRCWPFVRGIHRSWWITPHKGQWRGALVFSLICTWINDWLNNGEAGDLRRIAPIMTSL